MIDRHIVVFSGVDPRVVEKMGTTLRSVGIETVAVKSDVSLPTYFGKLIKQTLFMVSKVTTKSGVRLSLVLVSSLDGQDRQAEDHFFFPAVRRIEIRKEWSNNPSAARKIADLVLQYFQSAAVKEFIHRLAAHKEQMLLLPPKNTPSKALMARFDEIYACSASEPSRKVAKEVVVQRSGKGLKVKDLQFVPVVNGEQHPVRRCTNTDACDLQAGFRFGAPIAARFEFDVSADNGLKYKTFYLCDNTSQRITTQLSHINMRMNDDFKEA